jgi:inorganic pyrophosphatase
VGSGLERLHTRDPDGSFRVVVESPGGSRVKLKYESGLGAFTISRPLVLGLGYPLDWGFIPGTSVADGDPLDAMIVFDAPTYPGVVVACRALAVLRVEQNVKGAAEGRRVRNDRILAEPSATRRPSAPLSERVRQELEAFFVSATLFEGKDPRILGWGSAEEAEALIDASSGST